MGWGVGFGELRTLIFSKVLQKIIKKILEAKFESQQESKIFSYLTIKVCLADVKFFLLIIIYLNNTSIARTINLVSYIHKKNLKILRETVVPLDHT